MSRLFKWWVYRLVVDFLDLRAAQASETLAEPAKKHMVPPSNKKSTPFGNAAIRTYDHHLHLTYRNHVPNEQSYGSGSVFIALRACCVGASCKSFPLPFKAGAWCGHGLDRWGKVHCNVSMALWYCSLEQQRLSITVWSESHCWSPLLQPSKVGNTSKGVQLSTKYE